MIRAFTKIHSIGMSYIQNIFNDAVEITEKVDGSQFDFGKIDGVMCMRSKGKELLFDAPEKMFVPAIEYVATISHLLPENTVFYSEYLKSPKHNVLAYSRVPKNNLILFGASDALGSKYNSDIDQYAKLLGIERVPVLYSGKIANPEELMELLETESILGCAKIEGVVVKNYARGYYLGGIYHPIMAGKFVSEAFKEVHKQKSAEYSSKGRWELFCEGYRTEARWQKAIQHLRDNGELENSPKDIGNLLKEIQLDIIEEEKQNIMEVLWKQFSQDLLRKSIAGFPQWYKEQLVEHSFNYKDTPNG